MDGSTVLHNFQVQQQHESFIHKQHARIATRASHHHGISEAEAESGEIHWFFGFIKDLDNENPEVRLAFDSLYALASHKHQLHYPPILTAKP